MNDLFGQQAQIIPNPQAYAGNPGRGPESKTCKQCDHYRRVHYRAGVFLKCALTENRWTHGAATDIKASTPACQYFEGKNNVK